MRLTARSRRDIGGDQDRGEPRDCDQRSHPCGTRCHGRAQYSPREGMVKHPSRNSPSRSDSRQCDHKHRFALASPLLSKGSPLLEHDNHEWDRESVSESRRPIGRFRTSGFAR
jgi:hypothetical protein